MVIRFSKSKKRIALLTTIFMALTLAPANIFAGQVPDISNHWAKEKIQNWMDKGIMKGYEDGTFKPDENISRAEFMSLVNGSFGYKDASKISYADVNASAWYANTVSVAVAAGYISGYPDNTIKPNNVISREEAASIITKIKKLEARGSFADHFSDAAALSWSKNAVGAVFATNIMNGYPDGSFRPKNPIKKGEAVVALDKALLYTSKDITYSTAGTYGPADGVLETEGNVKVTAKSTILQNMTIKGNLIIDKNVGDGDVNLDKVIVTGETMIYGGGQNSIKVNNSTLGKVTVSKADGKIRLVISGNTTVKEVVANSGIKLEENNITGTSQGFQDITCNAPKDCKISLVGSFGRVEVMEEDLLVEIANLTTIDTLILYKKTEVTGTGTVKIAEVKANGIAFDTSPLKINLDQGITEPTIRNKVSTGRRSSGGGASIHVAVSNITITSSATTITTDKGTLQMVAVVEPTGATNKTVKWTVENTTGVAVMSPNGLLTAITSGAVKVKATAQDGSNKVGELIIQISGQTSPDFIIKDGVLEQYFGNDTSFVIPDGITGIGNAAFKGCIGLTCITIPASVTHIGDAAFEDCIGLTSITIPSSVTSIGGHAFDDCKKLTSITIPTGVTTISMCMFQSCSGLTSVTIPAGVTSIGDSAFANCHELTSITIPAGVTSIGMNAFVGCRSLTNIAFSDGLTSIGINSFGGCTGLTNITIPTGVTSIGIHSFAGCSGLTSITLPTSVTTIDRVAFYGCNKLTSITIPASVTAIGNYAFSGCTMLTSIYFEGNAPTIDATCFEDCLFTAYYLSDKTGFDLEPWKTTYNATTL